VTKPARAEYTEAVRLRYVTAAREMKSRILDEYCRTLQCHRKAAIRVLGRVPQRRRRPGRRVQYDRRVVPILERIWQISDRLCGKLLVAALPTLVPALERHGMQGGPEHRRQLLTLSPATIDRLLRPSRTRLGRQPYRTSLAAHALKQQIPIRTWGDWAGSAPGAVQGDLVLHCGESTEGFHLSSLVAVDVASGWIELEPIWGVGAVRVGAGVEHIHRRLPVPLREWHTDNGSEFVNGALLRYCRRQGIRVTRGRQYRKNDQAWVELRNWLAVRRLVGRDRYSSHVAFGLLQRLYALLRVQLNFFRPFRKVLHTRRVGSQRVRRYDAAQTPLSALASHRKPLRRAARCARGRVSRRRSRTACHPNWRYSRAALEVWRPAANSRISGNPIVRHRRRLPVTPSAEASRGASTGPTRPGRLEPPDRHIDDPLTAELLSPRPSASARFPGG